MNLSSSRRMIVPPSGTTTNSAPTSDSVTSPGRAAKGWVWCTAKTMSSGYRCSKLTPSMCSSDRSRPSSMSISPRVRRVISSDTLAQCSSRSTSGVSALNMTDDRMARVRATLGSTPTDTRGTATVPPARRTPSSICETAGSRCRRRRSPASVSVSPRPPRSKSGCPTRVSSSASDRETAGWEEFISFAAAVIDPQRAMVRKQRTCRILRRFSKLTSPLGPGPA